MPRIDLKVSFAEKDEARETQNKPLENWVVRKS